MSSPALPLRRRRTGAALAAAAAIALTSCGGGDEPVDLVCDRVGDFLEALRRSGQATSQAGVGEALAPALGDLREAGAELGDDDLARHLDDLVAAAEHYAAGTRSPAGPSVDAAVTAASDRCFALGRDVDLSSAP